MRQVVLVSQELQLAFGEVATVSELMNLISSLHFCPTPQHYSECCDTHVGP